MFLPKIGQEKNIAQKSLFHLPPTPPPFPPPHKITELLVLHIVHDKTSTLQKTIILSELIVYFKHKLHRVTKLIGNANT